MKRRVLLVVLCLICVKAFCGNGTYTGEDPNSGMKDEELSHIVQTGNEEQSQTANQILEERHRSDKRDALAQQIKELTEELESVKTNRNNESDPDKINDQLNQLYSQLSKVEKEIAEAKAKSKSESSNQLAEKDSATPGDPVKASVGAYIQNETDIENGLFEVKRKYESDDKIISSFGFAWTTNLDQRIILGTEPMAAEKYARLMENWRTLKEKEREYEQTIIRSFSVSSIASGKSEISSKFNTCNSIESEADKIEAENDCDVDTGSLFSAISAKRAEIESELRAFDAAVSALAHLSSEAARYLREAEEYKAKILDKSNERKVRNKKVMFAGSSIYLEDTGLDTITIMDEEGNPHVLYETEYASEIWLSREDSQYAECKRIEEGYHIREKSGIEKVFDNAGFIIKITDRNKNYLTIKRAPDEKIISAETSFGESYSFTYDGNFITKITNDRSPDENVVYTYTGNRLTEVRDTDGDTVIMDYDSDGRMKALNKCDGSHVSFIYGEETSDGRVLATATTNEEGFSENFVYYRNEKRTDYIDHDKNKTSYWYDDKHRTVKEIRPDGSVIKNDYDEKGKLKSVNENGNITNYSYDDDGNRTEAAYSDGSHEYWTYNSYRQITSYINRAGDKADYSYDERGNLTEYSLNGTTVYKQIFNEKGQLVKRIISGQKSIVTEYSYDEFGNLKGEVCGGVKSEYEYDSRNRAVKITVAGKTVTEYEYEEHKILQTDYNGLETVYLTNGRKDLVKVTQKDTVTGIIHETVIDYDKRHLPLRVYTGDGDKNKLTALYLYTAEGKLKAEVSYGKDCWIKMYEYEKGQISEIKQFMTSEEKEVRSLETSLDEGLLKRLLLKAGENVYIQKYDYTLQNGNRKLLTVTDGLGIKNLFEYDCFGKLVKTTDGKGDVREKEYNKGQLIKEQGSYGGWYEYGYENGNVSKAHEEESAAWAETRYYPEGSVKSVKDRYGQITYYNYDDKGRISGAVNDAKKIWYEYDDFDRLVKEVVGNTVDEACAVYYEKYEYSEDGRRVTVSEGGKYKTVNDLDAFGNVIKQTAGNTNERSYVYNTLNQLTESYDGYGNKTQYGYNALGLIAEVTLPDGAVTNYKYNYMGKLVKITDDCGTVYQASYDKGGRLLSERNRADSGKSYEYDNAGRVTKVLCGGEVVESYQYGKDSRTVTVTDGMGNGYFYNYDAFGRLVNERNRNYLEQKYFYDKNGQLKSEINFDGSTTTISYSDNRTIRTVKYSDGSENLFVYDAMGNIIEASNAYGKTLYRYDQGGKLDYQKDVSTGEEVFFEYDEAGNRTKLKSANRETKYTYGKNNEVKEVFDNKQRISIKLGYDKNGREILRQFGNGTEEVTLYDRAGRVTVKMQKDSRDQILWGEGYVYGTDGKRTATVTNAGLVTLYEYNKKGQLSTVYYPYSQEMENNLKDEAQTNGLISDGQISENRFLTGSEKSGLIHVLNSMQYGLSYNLSSMHIFIKESYEYDRNGNRKAKVTPYGKIEYVYDKENCLLSSGSNGQAFVNYTYDNMGNLLTEVSEEKTVQYAYNAQNRMIYCEVMDRSKKEFAETSYAYDAFGRRILVQDKGEAALQTLYDGLTFDVIKQSPVFENGMFTDSNNTGIQWGAGKPTGDRYRYISDEDSKDKNRYFYLDENTYKTVNSRYRGERTKYTVNGSLAAQTSKDYGAEYFSTDLLGSVSSVTDSYGTQKVNYTYDAFGSLVQGKLLDTTDFGYLSKQSDITAKLYDYGYRDYKPQVARFTTIDPIRDGENWFIYVNNDPIGFIDLFGLEANDIKRNGSSKRNKTGLDFSKLGENNKKALLSEINEYSYNQFYLENNMLREKENTYNNKGSTIFGNDLLEIVNSDVHVEVIFAKSTIDEFGNTEPIRGGYCTYDKENKESLIAINPQTALYTAKDGSIHQATPCGVLIHELSGHLLPEIRNVNGNAVENENAIRLQLSLPLRMEDKTHVCF